MKKQRKLRLKKGVKKALQTIGVIISLIFIVLMFAYGAKSYEKTAEECDKVKGHTCTIYEVNQYRIERGEK